MDLTTTKNPLNSLFANLYWSDWKKGNQLRPKIVLANIEYQRGTEQSKAVRIAEDFRDYYAQEYELANLAKILIVLASLYNDQNLPEKGIAYLEKAIELMNGKKDLSKQKNEAESLLVTIKNEAQVLNPEKIALEKDVIDIRLKEEMDKGD